jgi:hypothetical protein
MLPGSEGAIRPLATTNRCRGGYTAPIGKKAKPLAVLLHFRAGGFAVYATDRACRGQLTEHLADAIIPRGMTHSRWYRRESSRFALSNSYSRTGERWFSVRMLRGRWNDCHAFKLGRQELTESEKKNSIPDNMVDVFVCQPLFPLEQNGKNYKFGAMIHYNLGLPTAASSFRDQRTQTFNASATA